MLVKGGVDNLLPLVYSELRRLAAARLAEEPSGQTLQPTALVHEAFLRLIGSPKGEGVVATPRWENRGHFFAAAAEAMRRIMIESARRKGRVKHGGGHIREWLDPNALSAPEADEELLALDEALQYFAEVEPQIAELVKLRFFGGLTLKEAASLLRLPSRTADAHWAYARAWLLDAIRRE